MGFFSNIRKKTITALTNSQQPSIKQRVNQVYQQTGKQIVEGLNKPTASTGKSIDELHGAAKMIAQMSNIGGGSKASGGKGIRGKQKEHCPACIFPRVPCITAAMLIDPAASKAPDWIRLPADIWHSV